MKAADVLADRIPFWQERNGVLGRDEARFLVDDLLAHGGQGVAILPDGTLWALHAYDWTGEGDPIYRLVSPFDPTVERMDEL